MPFIGSLHFVDSDHLRALNLISSLGGYLPGLTQIWIGPTLPLCVVTSAAALKILMKEDSARLPKMVTSESRP